MSLKANSRIALATSVPSDFPFTSVAAPLWLRLEKQKIALSVDIGKRRWHSTRKQPGLLRAYAKRKVQNGQHECLQQSDVPCDLFGAECRAKFMLWQFRSPPLKPLFVCWWMRTAFQSTAGAGRLPQMAFFFFFNSTSALNRLHGDVPWSFQRRRDNSHEDRTVCMSDMPWVCVCICANEKRFVRAFTHVQ